MACSTCDSYEFVQNPDDPDGLLIDCPDCRAVDVRPFAWCPVHSTRVMLDGNCATCAREAWRATAALLARTLKRAESAEPIELQDEAAAC